MDANILTSTNHGKNILKEKYKIKIYRIFFLYFTINVGPRDLHFLAQITKFSRDSKLKTEFTRHMQDTVPTC